MNLDTLYQKTILEYASIIDYKGEIKGATHIERGHNPSCGDDLTLVSKIENGVIQDLKFLGRGCAISTASTNMMIEVFIGKTVTETKELLKVFFDMMENKEVDENDVLKLGDASLLKFAYNMPARIKCVTLSWHCLEVIVNK